MTIYEPVVANTHLSGPGPLPSLSATLFKPGARVIALVRTGSPPEMLDGVDPDLGLIPGTPTNETAIELMLGIRRPSWELNRLGECSTWLYNLF